MITRKQMVEGFGETARLLDAWKVPRAWGEDSEVFPTTTLLVGWEPNGIDDIGVYFVDPEKGLVNEGVHLVDNPLEVARLMYDRYARWQDDVAESEREG